ncbi:MAG: hypothetical protein AAGG08_00690 [Actinomycetota bacterium]
MGLSCAVVLASCGLPGRSTEQATGEATEQATEAVPPGATATTSEPGAATPAAEPGATAPDAVVPDAVVPDAATPAPASSAAPNDSAEAPVVGLRAAAAERCTVGFEAMERRVEAEGFEWPEEFPELSEDELETIMFPEYVAVDGVADPTDASQRPTIEPMTEFDPDAVSILELDVLVAICVERGIVTEADLFGSDGWCDELADLTTDDARRFVEEEGEVDARAAFHDCGLPYPLAADGDQ